jgi:hypothetical protein
MLDYGEPPGLVRFTFGQIRGMIARDLLPGGLTLTTLWRAFIARPNLMGVRGGGARTLLRS